MRKFLVLFYSSFYIWFIPIFIGTSSAFAQNPGEWVWMRGSSVTNNSGNYGIQGVSSPLNEPPAMYEACEWTDLNGNFWMYGGYNNNISYSDLWKYDPVINEWTWVSGLNIANYTGYYGTQGVADPANQPPSRSSGFASWVDLAGNLWMFGGYNSGNSYYSDLWKYDISTNIWTWMKGPSATNQVGVYGAQGVPNIANTPGARVETAAAWTDNNGDLWLFGGMNRDGGSYFNDLWRYNIATNTWTWMKGSQLLNQGGVYGTQGVEDPANTPSSRIVYSRWKDNNGSFWLHGGRDYNGQFKNDLWRFNPVTNNWTWMNGSNSANVNGRYGTRCIPSAANTPGQRYENRAAWKDANGDFWMFGGVIGGFSNSWNDLWKYCVATNQWIWTRGDTIANPTGNWGTKGVSNPANKPNGRCGAMPWTDNNGTLYFFGGSSAPWPTIYNDLWKFKIDPTCGVCVQNVPQSNFVPSDTTFCGEGQHCIDFFDRSTNNPTSWQWYFPGAVPDTSSSQNPAHICYNQNGVYDVTLIVSNAAGTDTLTISPMVKFSAGPLPPNITLYGDSLVSNSAFHYQWFINAAPIAGANDSFYVAHQPGTYAVQVTDSLGCSSLSNGILITGVLSTEYKVQSIKIYPNPAGDEFTVYGLQFAVGASLEIYNVFSEKVYSRPIEAGNKPVRRTPDSFGETVNCKQFAAGLYFIRVTDERGSYSAKFVKQ